MIEKLELSEFKFKHLITDKKPTEDDWRCLCGPYDVNDNIEVAMLDKAIRCLEGVPVLLYRVDDSITCFRTAKGWKGIEKSTKKGSK